MFPAACFLLLLLLLAALLFFFRRHFPSLLSTVLSKPRLTTRIFSTTYYYVNMYNLLHARIILQHVTTTTAKYLTHKTRSKRRRVLARFSSKQTNLSVGVWYKQEKDVLSIFIFYFFGIKHFTLGGSFFWLFCSRI